MMYYIESRNTEPYYNLALEQHIFDKSDRNRDYFMLWQNDNSIIVGKHQNTAGEINHEYVKEHGIRVARRLSGGGAVYHDLGNLNFTFIVSEGKNRAFGFEAFCRPVAMALASMGVNAEISGRNDMTIDGKKFSGNAQYRKDGRIMHHGTLLFDSDLQVISNSLRVSRDKIESKGVKSVISRVTNIKPYLQKPLTMEDFWAALRDFMFRENDMQSCALSQSDLDAVQALRDNIYCKWEWNYGASPAYEIRKERRVEGCGKVEIHISVTQSGIVEEMEFFGDYFSLRDSRELAQALKGCPLEEAALLRRLSGVPVGEYFVGMKPDELVAALVQ